MLTWLEIFFTAATLTLTAACSDSNSARGSENRSSASPESPESMGASTFQDPRHYPVGDSPKSITAGDFNGDGTLDLATANSGGPSQRKWHISVLSGRGDGTFKPRQRFSVSDLAVQVIAGEFNGDHALDLAIAYRGSHDSILFGNGDGTFTKEVRFRAGELGGPNRLTAADFNDDGNLDLVAPLRDANVAVLLGRGDGSFKKPKPISVGAYPIFITAADFDGNGTTANEGGNVSVVLNTGIAPELSASTTTSQNQVKQPRTDLRREQILNHGQEVYQNICSACHQRSGKGLPDSVPPLRDSKWVTTANVDRLIRIVVNGLEGPIEVRSQRWDGTCPPQHNLSPNEIAAVLSFIRKNKIWGHKASLVTPNKVEAIRKELADRSTPWTATELKELYSK